MPDQIISFNPENDKAFVKALNDLGKATDDFRIPFGLIANDWYKSNRLIFGLKSPGLYTDLGGFLPNRRDRKIKGERVTRREYAKYQKKKEVGFVYPILKRHGDIERSMSSKSSPGAEFFIGRQTLIMGTQISYAKFHQSDRTPRKKLPQRKLIFISGGPAEKAKDARISGRRERWLKIINEHILQLLTGEII